MRFRGSQLLPALAMAWIGCEQAPVIEQSAFKESVVESGEEQSPQPETRSISATPQKVPPKESKAQLDALLKRLEHASEEVTQAEGDLDLVFGAVADSKGNRYVGQLKNGKRHGYGTYQFANGDKYEGEYRDGKKQGYGTYQFKSGDRYVGYFEDGRYHNWGAYLFANGDKYFGQYDKGKRNGKGTLDRANGQWYEGDFVQGKRHGLGRCTFKNGDRYAGSWKNDEPDGWGSYHYGYRGSAQEKSDGQTTNASTTRPISDSLPEGIDAATREALAAGDAFLAEALELPDTQGDENRQGDALPSLVGQLPPVLSPGADQPLVPTLQELPGGDRYVGQLRDGQPHGQGAYLFSGGERYVGDFLHGLHHDQGLLVLEDGRRYLGEWKSGLRHGYGVLYDPEGQVEREGQWAKDEPAGN